MALSKYELGIILTLGALGFAILAGVDFLQSLINVLTDPSILALIVVMILIPILGGIMEESGLMMEMILAREIFTTSVLCSAFLPLFMTIHACMELSLRGSKHPQALSLPTRLAVDSMNQSSHRNPLTTK